MVVNTILDYKLAKIKWHNKHEAFGIVYGTQIAYETFFTEI